MSWVFNIFYGLTLCFILTGIAAIFNFIFNRKTKSKIVKIIKWQFGCLGFFMILILINTLYLWLFIEPQDADQERYEEIFGYGTSVADYDMLSNHSGANESRLIFLRAKVTDKQQKRLLNIRGLQPSSLTIDDVKNEDKGQVSSWWLGNEARTITCDNGKVYEVQNFNRWKTLIIAHCPIKEQEFSEIVAHSFIIAKGRRNE